MPTDRAWYEKDNARTRCVTACVTRDFYAEAAEQAKRQGLSLSAYTRRALHLALEFDSASGSDRFALTRTPKP